MPTFIITAHLAFPTKSKAITSGQIRLEIPADSESEARSKARVFIESKWRVEIDSCENKERKAFAESILGAAGFPQDFKDIFKGL
jgi:hypothetical protein